MSEKTCRVPTPLNMVTHMLDKIGYIQNLYGKKLLENSCGEGNFLQEIVRRYILDARQQRIPDSLIRDGLERDIHGIEKEESLVQKCRANLDATAEKLGIKNVNWCIQKEDALNLELDPIYQYVVGNPPYITYYNLKEEERIQIRQKFKTCEVGKADYYYAFTEAALRSLASDGKMAYLIPNNFFKNRYSDELRKYILPYLVEVEDYTTKKLFAEYLTSSAVIFCQKNMRKKTFKYCDVQNGRSMQVKKESLQGKWSFFTERKQLLHPKRMGDCFQISAPVATLLNEAFILKNAIINDDGDFNVNGVIIEHKVVRSAASPKSMQRGEIQYIIFPYWYDADGRLMRYDCQEFEQRFPGACIYLKGYEKKLSNRNNDLNSKWYEYGRSQALTHINQPKLLLSTLITNRVRYYRLDRETVPYSGMYLIPRAGYTLEQAERILDDADFFAYIEDIGINASGNSFRISPKDVCEYMFEGK